MYLPGAHGTLNLPLAEPLEPSVQPQPFFAGDNIFSTWLHFCDVTSFTDPCPWSISHLFPLARTGPDDEDRAPALDMLILTLKVSLHGIYNGH